MSIRDSLVNLAAKLGVESNAPTVKGVIDDLAASYGNDRPSKSIDEAINNLARVINKSSTPAKPKATTPYADTSDSE